MDSPLPPSLPLLEQLIDAYEDAIKNLESIAAAEPQTDASHQLIMAALLARDAVEKVRQDCEQSATTLLSAHLYARLVKLDQCLKGKTEMIVAHGDLENSRQSVNPDPQAWWWFLTPPPKPVKQHAQDRFDWVWNGLTVVCLVTATSFITSTAKAFSIQGFDVLGLFSSFIQGAGLAFVAGGAFTDKGQKAVQHVLRSVNIPGHHHSEATFALAASLLGVSFVGHSNLYRLGNLYYSWGQGERERGDNISAFSTFQKALDFSPDKREVYSSLGQVAEKMGRLEDASAYYEQGLALSDPASALGLARLSLINTLKESGWGTPIDSTKVREIRFFLELSSQFNLGFDEDGNPTEVVDVVIDNQTHYGMLELAKIDFNSIRPNPVKDPLTVEEKRGVINARSHLSKALTYFQQAQWEESKTLAIYRPTDEAALLEKILNQTSEVKQVSQSAVDPQLSEDEEKILDLAVRQAASAPTSNPEFAQLMKALDELTYLERTNLIDQFITDLPADYKRRLQKDLTLDLGKPRCYIAIILLIDASLKQYLLSSAKDKTSDRPNLIQSRRQFTSRECGNIEISNEGDLPSQGYYSPPLNRIDLYTLSIHEKSLINDLLSIPEPFLSTVSE